MREIETNGPIVRNSVPAVAGQPGLAGRSRFAHHARAFPIGPFLALLAVMALPVEVLADPAAHPAPTRHYQVYVGSAFFEDRMVSRAAWPETAAHVDGFYNHPVGWRSLTAAQKRQLLANFAHKTVIQEGDLSMPVAQTAGERDTIFPEVTAGGMPTGILFENEVKPNKPQDKVDAVTLAADQAEWDGFCRDTQAKTKASTYFMTAAFQTDGEIYNRPLTWDSPVWDYARTDILAPACGGAGLDSPVDNYLLGPPARRQAVWDMTRWTQRQGKTFIYVASPGDPNANNNGTQFIQHLQQNVASLEDNDAEPDIYAVESYIPTGPDTVPERNVDGSAASTITGGAYYLLKHRDGEPGTLHLSATAGEGAAVLSHSVSGGRAYHEIVMLTNSSPWLDYAPVLKAAVRGGASAWDVKFLVGGTDVTPQVFGAGYLFYRSQRLNPKTSQRVEIVLTPKRSGVVPPLRLTLQASPHSGSAGSAVLDVRHT